MPGFCISFVLMLGLREIHLSNLIEFGLVMAEHRKVHFFGFDLDTWTKMILGFKFVGKLISKADLCLIWLMPAILPG